jgi:4-carboxymuconolactone decarboxylase
LPPSPREQWTVAQQAAAAELISGPRGEVRGPFVPLLRSPELFDRAQKLGEYLRYRSAVPEALKEFAILLAARHWRQGYEWQVHAPIAIRAGVDAGTVATIGAGLPPEPLSAEQRVVHEFCTQLLCQQTVDDRCYQRALALLGEAGVVDLCGICGYYSLLAMVMNVARTPCAAVPPLPFEPAAG